MAQPVSSAGETYRDYGTLGKSETASFEITTVDLTAGNVAAQIALLITLWADIDALVLGNIAKRQVVFTRTEPDISAVTNPAAQRENKWLARYHDTSNRKFRVELPTANLELLTGGDEFLDLTADEGLAFKTSFEAVAKSPTDQSGVTLDSVQFVGRRT